MRWLDPDHLVSGAQGEAISTVAKRIGERVRDVAPALLALPGCGELTAANLIGEADTALRCLKRPLARVVFQALRTDQDQLPKPCQPAAA